MEYVIGIDAGIRSLGFSAVQYADGKPVNILEAYTQLHDGGVSPRDEKTKVSRRHNNGLARRARNAKKTRKQRLKALDNLLDRLGLPETDIPGDQFWSVRAQLMERYIDNDTERLGKIRAVVRHMARHRGWRNSYQNVQSIDPLAQTPVSTALADTIYRSISQYAAQNGGIRGSRNCQNVPFNSMRQSDNLAELNTIFATQHFDQDSAREIVQAVFFQKSPRGSHVENVGYDQLPGMTDKPRASKASLAFQEFRILHTLSNLKVKDAHDERSLTLDEIENVSDFLFYEADENVSWSDVEAVIGLGENESLTGYSFKRGFSRPPFNTTFKELRRNDSIFAGQDEDVLEAVVDLLIDQRSSDLAEDFLSRLDDSELSSLDSLRFEIGRSPYSADSLNLINEGLMSGYTLPYTLYRFFGVDPTWKPRPSRLDEKTGNLAVDRVLSYVQSFVDHCTDTYGQPSKVVIESVKDSFTSVAKAQEKASKANRRFQIRQNNHERFTAETGQQPSVRAMKRWEAVKRQKNECVYCGAFIDFHSCQRDHIIPQASDASNSVEENLVAVCAPCNQEKSNTPFAVWAKTTDRKGVSVKAAIKRAKKWKYDKSVETFDSFIAVRSGVIRRLSLTSYAEVDSRQMAPVARMAVEMKTRLMDYLPDTEVVAYSGALTHAAWIEGGFSEKNWLHGGPGKQRGDNRHHALDAIIFTLMNDDIARVFSTQLKWYINSRNTDIGQMKLSKKQLQAIESFKERSAHMITLIDENIGSIDVRTPVRKKLYSGSVHEDTIKPFDRSLKLTDKLSASDIKRAATPQLYDFLTSFASYSPTRGLPADANRRAKKPVAGLHSDGTLDLFGSSSACVAVRGGWALIGAGVHHVRIFKHKDRYIFQRVFTSDLAGKKGSLFYAKLPKSSMTMRQLSTKDALAIHSGDAKRIGALQLGSKAQVNGRTWIVRACNSGKLVLENPYDKSETTIVRCPSVTDLALAVGF
ncbi:type II CRISPR RNA-guided endonuclease Cas9 [Actinomyces vulturis]|uniref:type II CRISPR RNA-guided endonuclease Cas9 n=1 Tax=Actinomyces vulturis TaxID=1857645 RepID=UPI00082A8D5B